MTDSPSPLTPPAWFLAEVTNGLQGLYALCPEGCPGADVFPATVTLWALDLWTSPRRRWHPDTDTWPLREAFATLRQTCHRWPTPAKFWECLPGVPVSNYSVLPPAGRASHAESQAEAAARHAAFLTDLGVTP